MVEFSNFFELLTNLSFSIISILLIKSSVFCLQLRSAIILCFLLHLSSKFLLLGFYHSEFCTFGQSRLWFWLQFVVTYFPTLPYETSIETTSYVGCFRQFLRLYQLIKILFVSSVLVYGTFSYNFHALFSTFVDIYYN